MEGYPSIMDFVPSVVVATLNRVSVEGTTLPAVFWDRNPIESLP